MKRSFRHLGQHGNGKSDDLKGRGSKRKTRVMVGRGVWSNFRSFLRPWGEVVKCLGVFGYLGEGAEVSGRFGGILARVLKCVVFVLNLGGRAWVSWRGCSSVWACLGILARVLKSPCVSGYFGEGA